MEDRSDRFAMIQMRKGKKDLTVETQKNKTISRAST